MTNKFISDTLAEFKKFHIYDDEGDFRGYAHHVDGVSIMDFLRTSLLSAIAETKRECLEWAEEMKSVVSDSFESRTMVDFDDLQDFLTREEDKKI